VLVAFSSDPGTTFAGTGVQLAVNEWVENALYLDFVSGAEKVVAVTALDADGNPSGRADDLEATRDGNRVRVDLNAKPQSLQVLLAVETVQHELPFKMQLAMRRQ